MAQEYAWKDVQLFMFGGFVVGARDVNYTASQDKEHVHGTGAEPLGIAFGQKTYEGSITLLQSELKKIQDALPAGSDLLDIQPFSVVVSYATATGRIETDRLEGCGFTEVPKGMGTDDSYMEVELPLVVTKIRYNV